MTQENIRSVLITGGTSGIGLATARLFLAEGARVSIVGRSAARGAAALASLGAETSRCFFIEADVAKTAEARAAVETAAQAFGGLDVVVNSAGIYFERAIEDMTEDAFDEILGINLKGTYFIAKYAVPYLKRSAAGAIVNVSSDAGLNGNFLCTAYCASKGAVTVLTKALALELAPYGVRVNCVCPGDVDTPLTRAQLAEAADREEARRAMCGVYPLGRIGTDEEIARVIQFLASPAAGFVVGAAWSVDGGVTAY